MLGQRYGIFYGEFILWKSLNHNRTINPVILYVSTALHD